MNYNSEYNMILNNYFDDKFGNIDTNYIDFLKKTRSSLLRNKAKGLFVDFSCNLKQDVTLNNEKLNLETIMQLLLNSNNINAVNYGRFLYNLVYKLNVIPNDVMIKIIYESISLDNNQITTTSKMDEIESLSNSCMLNLLYRNKQDMLATNLMKKMINNNLEEEEEFNLLVQTLLLKNNSENDMLTYVISAYKEAYKNGDKKITMDNLRKMLILSEMYGLKFKSSSNSSYWSETDNTVYLEKSTCGSFTVFHEFGHAIDTYFNQRKHGKKEKIYERAREHALSCPYLTEEIIKLNIYVSERKSIAQQEYNNTLLRKYGSIENAHKEFYNYAKYMINNYGIDSILNLYGISGTTRKKVLENYQNGMLDLNHIAYLLMETDMMNYSMKVNYDLPECAMLDIIAAVFKNNQFVINNQLHFLAIGHDSNYFHSYKDASMSEIMANYNAIKVSGREDLINRIRTIFGDEFINIIESYYHTSQNTKDVSIAK